MTFSLLLVPVLLTQAESPESARDAWNRYYLGIAKQYSIVRGDKTAEKLQLVERAALHWANPQRVGQTHGAFFVWTHRGRAEAVGTIFSFHHPPTNTYRNVVHEFHSFSTASLTAKFKGKKVWAPREKAVKFRAVEGARKPARTAALRLTQMRRIAKQFTVKLSTSETETQELRLLPQPLYRYVPRADSDFDGAVFTLVMGTDPECLMIIETNQAKEADGWQVGFARFTHAGFEVHHRGDVVFSHVKGTEPDNDPSHRYICIPTGRAPLTAPPDDRRESK